eukprot:UN02951
MLIRKEVFEQGWLQGDTFMIDEWLNFPDPQYNHLLYQHSEDQILCGTRTLLTNYDLKRYNPKEIENLKLVSEHLVKKYEDLNIQTLCPADIWLKKDGNEILKSIMNNTNYAHPQIKNSQIGIGKFEKL